MDALLRLIGHRGPCVEVSAQMLLPLGDVAICRSAKLVTYAIRPENITLCDLADEGALPLQGALIEPTGLSELNHGALYDEPVMIYSTLH